MISVKHLKKSFGNNEVLKDISLEVKPQEVLVVIGPSGSGKSTLIRCLNLLESVSGGQVVVTGKDLTDKKTDINEIRKNVGMVFQHFNLFPHKTILQNITLAPINVKGVSKEEAEKKSKRTFSEGRLIR